MAIGAGIVRSFRGSGQCGIILKSKNMELDENKIKARIEEIDKILFVPPGGRMGGIWEEPLIDEKNRLTQLLSFKKYVTAGGNHVN